MHPYHPVLDVDLFASPPIDPDEMIADAEWIDLASIYVPVASRTHLIRMKEIAGRPQDLADMRAVGSCPMGENWGGWNPHAAERRAAIADMSPLQRIEWLEATLVAFGPERLERVRAQRQQRSEAVWNAQQDSGLIAV